jgi:hypothetical protein
VHMCDEDNLPILVGRDFHIIRWQDEKYNDNFIARWPFIFNPVIESLDLWEIDISFTWENRREASTYKKLDQVLTSVSCEQKVTLVSVRALTREGSDHTPYLIDSSEQSHTVISLLYFLNYNAVMVCNIWEHSNGGTTK